jgi:hypothetical protein
LSEVQYLACSRRRAEGNERGVGGLLIPLAKRGKGGVGYLFLGYKEKGDSPVTGYWKSDQKEWEEEEEAGRRSKATCGTQAGNCVYEGRSWLYG